VRASLTLCRPGVKEFWQRGIRPSAIENPDIRRDGTRFCESRAKIEEGWSRTCSDKVRDSAFHRRRYATNFRTASWSVARVRHHRNLISHLRHGRSLISTRPIPDALASRRPTPISKPRCFALRLIAVDSAWQPERAKTEVAQRRRTDTFPLRCDVYQQGQYGRHMSLANDQFDRACGASASALDAVGFHGRRFATVRKAYTSAFTSIRTPISRLRRWTGVQHDSGELKAFQHTGSPLSKERCPPSRSRTRIHISKSKACSTRTAAEEQSEYGEPHSVRLLYEQLK